MKDNSDIKDIKNIKNIKNENQDINQDLCSFLINIKNIYSPINSPVILCDIDLNSIWRNSSAENIFKKVNIDLILSKDNLMEISKIVEENRHSTINASFLPFLGCKINVTPVKNNNFCGAILIFEISEKDDILSIFNNTDHIVSILSSNLRLPMHLITNALDILNYDIEKMKHEDKDKIKKSITVVENNTYKMCRICKNLSELIRFSTDSNPFEKSLIKISEYINNLIDGCSNYIRMSGQNVIYNFSSTSDAPRLMMLDCEKFDIAISNIILNSCQNSNKNTKITITVFVTKEVLNITIEDEGFGIAQDKIGDIFRPYTTVENRHYVSKGMGIGLTLAKYIINQHNGTIEVESEVDVGTVVKISIPIVCSIDNKVVKINSFCGFRSKMSTIAVQFSPLSY